MRSEQIVFTIAAAVVAAHLVDHMIVGVEMDLQFSSVLVFGALTVVAALAYPFVPRQLQAVVSIALGLGWLVGDFVLHALPTIRDGPGSTDYTGPRGDACRWPAHRCRRCGGASWSRNRSPAERHAVSGGPWVNAQDS